MIYRLDYVLVVIAAGVFGGALLGRRASRGAEPHLVARAYFIAIAMLVGVRCLFRVVDNVQGELFWPAGSTGTRYVSDFLFGAVLGCAGAPKEYRWALLREPQILSALCLQTGVAFALPWALGDSPWWRIQAGFFAQSGYSLSFLRFILTIELLGGIALLLDWMVLPATIGLSMDMFGAIYTHAYNRDELYDDTAALVMLLRLGAIATIWVVRRRAAMSRTPARSPLWGVAAGGVVCAVAAVVGGSLIHRSRAASLVSTASASEPGLDSGFDDLVGRWHCAGQFASGKPIEADLDFERTLDGNGLLLRHDDRPPNRYHAIAQWARRGERWVATLHDSSGSARVLYSAGWQGGHLVWSGNDITSDAPVMQRFDFERPNGSQFQWSYAVQQASGDWRSIDTSTCTRRLQ